VALYLAALAEDHKPATLTRRPTPIARAHEAAGLGSPATLRVSETLKGIGRTHGIAQHRKTPLLTADLVQTRRPCASSYSGPATGLSR